MQEVRTPVAEGGRIVLPDEYRRALGLHIGDEVILRLENDEIRILAPREAIRRAQTLIRESIPEGRSLSDELIAERRAAATNE